MENNLSHHIFVARQPIFDRKLQVYGYEILFRDSDIKSANIRDGEVATSKVILDGFSIAQQGIKKNAKLFVNFPYNFLISGMATVLPKECAVIEILEDVIIDRKVLKSCIELKKKGYLIALDDYIGHVTNEKLFKIIDVVKIDVLNMDYDLIRDLIKKVKMLNPKIKVLIEKVEDENIFKITRSFGGDYFQGFFFQQPEIIKGRSIAPTTVTRLKLLNFFSRKREYDIEDLENIIKTDISLSYKLLQYINSPAIGLPNKIKYIRQAINLLGYKNVVKWCRIFLLTLINPSDRGIELIRMSSIRGYFLMCLRKFIQVPATEDELFLLGLFSLLDALLEQPMKEIVKLIPLEDLIKKTLLGEITVLAPYIDIIKLQEQGKWRKLPSILKKTDLSMDIITSCYSHALNETNDLFQIE